MVIGERLRELREAKNLSQGDVQQRTGLLRCYTSRVEHGHTIPSIETLEKYAKAFGVPLYMFFYDGTAPIRLSWPKPKAESVVGVRGKGYREMRRFAKAMSRMNDSEQQLFLYLASAMASRNSKGSHRVSSPV
jgi:transcriptional regulator with XRE-family HTH domain